MKTINGTTTVRLYFPNTGRTYEYTYPRDMERNRVEDAMRDFYEGKAATAFALYGYGPMDVTVHNGVVEVARYRSCYQETLWGIYFREGGEPWHGRFSHFDLSLHEYRYNQDQRKAA